jgi:hypothetical protein
VKSDWTRWSNVKLFEGSKGYQKGNPHAEALTTTLRTMCDRRDVVYHQRTLWPSKEENPNYEHFPGYGNRISLHAEACPAVLFVRGVYDTLQAQCADHIARWSFDIDDRVTFQQPTSYSSIEALVQAVKDLPPVDEVEDDEEEEAAAPAWKAEIVQQINSMQEKITQLEGAVTSLLLK